MEVDTKTGIIYCWRNIHNGKRYVGQTIHPKKRYNEHKHHLGNYDDQNLFGRALNKYSSMDDWEYYVIEEVPKEMLDEREIYWIAFYDSNDPKHGYNMSKGGMRHDGYKPSEETCKRMSESMKGKNTWMKGKKLSEETRKKISESLKGKKRPTETCKKISESKKGRKHSEESRRKMSESLKGKPAWNKGKKPSHETRRKMSKSHNPNRVAVYQNDMLIAVCDTIAEASYIADVSRRVICFIIAGRYHQTRSGYSFKYISKSA